MLFDIRDIYIAYTTHILYLAALISTLEHIAMFDLNTFHHIHSVCTHLTIDMSSALYRHPVQTRATMNRLSIAVLENNSQEIT